MKAARRREKGASPPARSRGAEQGLSPRGRPPPRSEAPTARKKNPSRGCLDTFKAEKAEGPLREAEQEGGERRPRSLALAPAPRRASKALGALITMESDEKTEP